MLPGRTKIEFVLHPQDLPLVILRCQSHGNKTSRSLTEITNKECLPSLTRLISYHAYRCAFGRILPANGSTVQDI